MENVDKYYRGSITDISEMKNVINPYWGGFKSVLSTDMDKAHKWLQEKLNHYYKDYHIQKENDYSYGEFDKKTICTTYKAISKTNLFFSKTIQISVYLIKNNEEIID